MTVTVIRVDGREETHALPKGAHAFPAIERLIGATTLDTVNLRDGRIMLVDDAGYETVERERVVAGVTHVALTPVRARKADNPKATALYHAVCRPGTTHRIVGDVAIVRDEDFE